jgi:hypothetical protein
MNVVTAFVVSLEGFTKRFEFSQDHAITCDTQHKLFSYLKDNTEIIRLLRRMDTEPFEGRC